MAISKNDLKEFIEDKIKGKRSQTKEDMNNMLLALLQTYYNKHIGNELTEIGDIALKMTNDLGDTINKYLLNNYSIRNAIFYLNDSIVDLDKTVKEDILQRVRDVVTDDNSYYDIAKAKKDRSRYDDELLAICEAGLDNAEFFYKKIEQLNTLKREIFSVIKAERSGEKAYKRLIELGVDMEGFIPVEHQLPAIIHLSVNVGLLNN